MLPHCNLVYMSEAAHANCILMYSVSWYIFYTQVLWNMTFGCLASSSQDLMKWRRYHNLTKHQEPLSEQHCVVSHKTSAFRNTAMRTSKPTDVFCHSLLLSVMFCFIWVIKYIFRPWSSFPDTWHWKIADQLLIFELHMCSRLLECTLFQGNAVFIYCFLDWILEAAGFSDMLIAVQHVTQHYIINVTVQRVT